MHHVAIVEAPQNMKNGIRFPDIPQKFVPETFTFACPFDQTCYVDNLDSCRNDILWLDQFGQFIQPWIWYGNHANVRFDGAKWEVRTLSFGVG